MTNGYTPAQQQQQHSQSQSPISFKTSIDPLSNLINRHPVSTTNKTSSSSSSVTATNLQQIPNTNGLPSSTITDQFGLVGLLQMIQQAEKSPDTSILLNYDLTTLGLSMSDVVFLSYSN